VLQKDSPNAEYGVFDVLLHEPRQRRSWLIFDVRQMKRAHVIPLIVFLVLTLITVLLLRQRHQTLLEIARLSESLVISKVQAYHHNPTESALAAVRDAIANHRKVLERSDLPRDANEAMERNLYEQIFIVRGIAHNDDLKL
jgi:hypothetical protein